MMTIRSRIISIALRWVLRCSVTSEDVVGPVDPETLATWSMPMRSASSVASPYPVLTNAVVCCNKQENEEREEKAKSGGEKTTTTTMTTTTTTMTMTMTAATTPTTTKGPSATEQYVNKKGRQSYTFYPT